MFALLQRTVPAGSPRTVGRKQNGEAPMGKVCLFAAANAAGELVSMSALAAIADRQTDRRTDAPAASFVIAFNCVCVSQCANKYR